MYNQKTRLSVMALAVVAALTLSACDKGQTGGGTTADGKEVVKIAFSAPLTGPQAHYGEEYKNGVTLALEDVNAENLTIGGKPVTFELVAEDDQADPKTATQVAQKFVDMKVNGIVGHFNSGTTIPASRIYEDNDLPNISMATSPKLTEQGFKTVFRSLANDTQQGSVVGKYAVEKLKAKNIAVIDDRTAYGQGLADEFEKAVKGAGGNIVKREFTTDKSSDFAAILTNIKATKPDLIFFGGTDVQSAPMVKQMKRLGLNVPLVSGEMTKTPTFITVAGKDADGTIASLAGVPLTQMPKGQDYETRYKERFKADVATYSPYGYDATRAMVEAMKQADSTDPKKYLPKLAAIDYAGVTSPHWSYDTKGDLKEGGITVYKVVGGKWTVLDTIGGAAKPAGEASAAK